MGNKLDVVSIRLVKDAPLMSPHRITTPEDAVELIGEHMRELDRETACIINMRTDGRPINCNFFSMGTIDSTITHPREALKSCILSNAASVILMHNHPSGNVRPSREDIMMTDRMLQVFALMGIPMIDHIIVGGNSSDYYSFKENEMLKFKPNAYVKDAADLQFPKEEAAEVKKNPQRSR